MFKITLQIFLKSVKGIFFTFKHNCVCNILQKKCKCLVWEGFTRLSSWSWDQLYLFKVSWCFCQVFLGTHCEFSSDLILQICTVTSCFLMTLSALFPSFAILLKMAYWSDISIPLGPMTNIDFILNGTIAFHQTYFFFHIKMTFD